MKCEICQAVVVLLDQYVEANATDEKINATLFALCMAVPEGEFRDLVREKRNTYLFIIETRFQTFLINELAI